MVLDFGTFIPRSYSAVVDAAGGGDFTTLQDAVDELVDGFSLWVKQGTYAAGFTSLTHDIKVKCEPGTVIQAAITMAGDKSTLELGSGCDVQGLITLSGDGCQLLCKNGVTTVGVLITGDRCYHNGGGWGTLHDGGVANHAISVTGDDCRVVLCSAQTTAGGGQPFSGLRVTGARPSIGVVRVVDSDDQAMSLVGPDGLVKGCVVLGADTEGFGGQANRLRIIGNYLINTGGVGISFGPGADNSVADGNIVQDPGGAPIDINAAGENCVVVGNRVDGAIVDASGTSTVGNNDETAF